MKGLIRGLTVLVFMAPISWARADISHTYVEGFVTRNQVETGALFGEEDAVGVDLAVSYEILRMMHVFGRIQYADFDDQPLEQTIAQIGIGYNWDVTADRNFFVNLALVNAELEVTVPTFGTLTGDTDAAEFAIGWRETNHTPLEFGVSVHYREYDDVAETNDKWMDLGFLYAINPRLSINGGIRFGGDDNNMRIGIRYYLPSRFVE